MVPGAGLEPARCYQRGILNPFGSLINHKIKLNKRVKKAIIGKKWQQDKSLLSFCCQFSEVVQGKRIELYRVFEVVWGEVGITHGHGDRGVTQDVLQYQNIAAIHHEVT